MENCVQDTPPAREDKRPQAAPIPDPRPPSVIRVGVARVPSYSLTLARRRPGT